MRTLSVVALVVATFLGLDARAETPGPPSRAPEGGAVPPAPPAPPPRGAPRGASAPVPVPPSAPLGTKPSPTAPPVSGGPQGGTSTLRYEPIFVPAPVFPIEGAVVLPFGEETAPSSPVAPAVRRTREEALGDARAALVADGPEAAAHLLAAWVAETATGDVDPAAIVASLIATERDAGTLGLLLSRMPAGAPYRDLVARRHAEVLCRSRDHAGCLAAASLVAGPDGVVELGGLRVPLAAFSDVRARAVGVVLPLTGTYAGIGKAAEKALRLAFEAVAGVELIVRDSRGEADTAAALTRELIVDARVVAIIGPVGRKEVAAAVDVSRALGVPHIVLASQLEPDPARLPELPEAALAPASPDTAIRVRTSPEELAQAVARHAVLELRLSRFAVLRPDSDAAQRAAEAFAEEAQRLGATLTDAVVIDAAAKDPKAAIKELLAPSRAAMTPRARRKGQPVQPRFDGLFIPDSASSIRRLLPFLEYDGLPLRRRPGAPGVQLLGISGWNHAAVIDPGTGLSNNAIFADTWLDAPDDPRSDRFSKRFYAVHAEAPTPFHAEVFDVGAVVADAVVGVSGADHRARGELLRRLVEAAPRPGVTGVIAFRGAEAAPRSHLLTVDGDRIRRRASEDEEAFLRGQVPGEATEGGLP
jgi:ABC-type branched-subunit amino acid transport system substrate-binding protein